MSKGKLQGFAPLLSMTAEYYVHIGAIVSRWAVLEYQLLEIIWLTMGLGRKRGRTLTIGMKLTVIIGILRTLPRKWVTDKELRAEIISIADAVQKHSEYRNFLAHGVWVARPDEDPNTAVPHLTYMKSAENRITPGIEPVTLGALYGFAERIHEINLRCQTLVNTLKERKASQQPF